MIYLLRIAMAILGLCLLVMVARATDTGPVLAGVIGLVYGVLAMRWIRS